MIRVIFFATDFTGLTQILYSKEYFFPVEKITNPHSNPKIQSDEMILTIIRVYE
jgi:hypothetical protein